MNIFFNFVIDFCMHVAYACAFYMQLKLHVACDYAFAYLDANAYANAVKNCMQLSAPILCRKL